MRSAKKLRASAVACVVGLALLPLHANAEQHVVTRVTILAKPRVVTGACPTTIEFTATIYVGHHPVFVDYEWEHSDGGRSDRQRAEITGPWHRVSDTWKVGTPGSHRKVWAKLHVLAPTSITSSQAVVTLNCR